MADQRNQRNYQVIDECNSATGWTVLGNDTDNLATTTRSPIGANALEFDKVDGAANTKLAGAYKTVTVDLEDEWFDAAPHDYIQWWCYVSSKADVDYTFVRIGTDASNYVEYRYEDDEMTAGRFTRCLVPLGCYSTSAGTHADFGDLDYLVVGVAFDAETDTLADIAIGPVGLFPGGGPSGSFSVGDVQAEVTVDAEAVVNGTAASHALNVGGIANADDPTYTEGKQAAASEDLAGYTRVRSKAYNPSGNNDTVEVIGSIEKARIEHTITQLTAAGSSEWVNITGLSKVTFGITIAAIDTSVTLRAEGSNDETAVWNLNDKNVDTVYTANDDYVMDKDGVSCRYVRLTMVGESGGTNVTVDATITALE